MSFPISNFDILEEIASALALSYIFAFGFDDHGVLGRIGMCSL